jgi:hypothetical protein
MSSSEHIEVAPRMWDKSIAASYTPKRASDPPPMEDPANDTEQESEESQSGEITTVSPATASVAMGFFTKLKQYLIPVAFVLAVMIVIYVLWKYFTKYRNAKKANLPIIKEDDLNKPPNPVQLIASEDMSKYEYETDDESEPDVKPKKRLETIAESSNEESDDEGSEEDSDDEADDESYSEESGEESEDSNESDDESDNSDEEDTPDLDEIEQMIHDHSIIDISDRNEPTDISTFQNHTHELEEETKDDITTEMFSLEIPSYITKTDVLPASSAKKPRKVKRVTL